MIFHSYVSLPEGKFQKGWATDLSWMGHFLKNLIIQHEKLWFLNAPDVEHC